MTFDIARKRMVDEQLRQKGIQDEKVLRVMGHVPRHVFLPESDVDVAYLDRPHAIGKKQTISQPYMVGLMTEALSLLGHERVLEIGTGSGYQTSVLAELAGHVYSVERIPSLSYRARKVLYQLGYVNFTLRIGDGTQGWPEQAPFDAILVTAGSPAIPLAYKEQLKEGGVLVLPVGDEESQTLVRIRKKRDAFEVESLISCRFVKLYGRDGWSENKTYLS